MTLQSEQTILNQVFDPDNNTLSVNPGPVILNGSRILTRHTNTTITNSIAETIIIPASGPGVFNDVISLVISNKNLVSGVDVTIRDMSSGTGRMIVTVPPLNSEVITPSSPIPQISNSNQNWTATLSHSSSIVNVFSQYVKNT